MSARFTPYEMAFSPPEYEDQLFPGISAELLATGGQEPDPDGFLRLATVGRALQAIEDADATLPADAIREHARLLFQGFRFWVAEKPLWALDEPVTRGLLTSTTALGDWSFTAPTRAGYLQLARHVVWAQTTVDAPAEPVDGMFWAISETGDGQAGQRLDTVLVLGMHPDRPGFSAVDVTGWLPAATPGHWGDIKVRADEPDFTSVLPGGDLGSLFSVTSGEEVMKLLSRAFHYLSVHAGEIGEPGTDLDAAPASRHELPPSRLAARIVTVYGSI